MKTLIAEYKTSGTYPVTIENTGYYNLEMVGAGAGGRI